MLINRNGDLVEDPWVHDAHAAVCETRSIVLTAPIDADRAEQVLAGGARLGLQIRGDDDLGEIFSLIDRATLIAMEFPAFTDGRAYTAARLLRVRYGFKGELRAVGHVLPDQIGFMLRCGFDSFVLSRERAPEVVRNALSGIRGVYQPAVDPSLPIWKRRAALQARPVKDVETSS